MINLNYIKDYLDYIQNNSHYEYDEIKQVFVDFLNFHEFYDYGRKIAAYGTENAFTIPNID